MTFAASKRFMPTYIIVLLNVSVYVYTSVLSGDFVQTSYDVILQYGQVNYIVLKGFYWQLFTDMFIHADVHTPFWQHGIPTNFRTSSRGNVPRPEYLLIYS